MKSQPIKKLVDTKVGIKNRWHFKEFSCQLSADVSGVIVKMKAGNQRAGEPGEEFEFFHPCKSLNESIAFVDKLPNTFGPNDCEKLGFIKTSWGIYD